MRFRPQEVLFSPTADCNLNCPHCGVKGSKKVLSKTLARKFLKGSRKIGIKRVGFTGGEPFLTLDFLCALTKAAVKENMFFDRIMTNAAWGGEDEFRRSLTRLYKAGYDGSICVSIDAFHRQDLKKAAIFIKTASSVWNRKDIVSIAYVAGAREDETRKILLRLSRLLGGRLYGFTSGHSRIRCNALLIKVFKISLSPVGKALSLKNPWDGKWFKEDHCEGPGNLFLVLPDGSVKPCCGYAIDSDRLTVGNIRRDSAEDIAARFRRNKFAFTVFNSGLNAIRKRLQDMGVAFPGKTSNHCYFCHHILTEIPPGVLEKCLEGLYAKKYH